MCISLELKGYAAPSVNTVGNWNIKLICIQTTRLGLSILLNYIHIRWYMYHVTVHCKTNTYSQQNNIIKNSAPFQSVSNILLHFGNVHIQIRIRSIIIFKKKSLKKRENPTDKKHLENADTSTSVTFDLELWPWP